MRKVQLNLIYKFEVTHDPLPSMKTTDPLRRKFNIRGIRTNVFKKYLPLHFLDAVT